MSTPAGLPYKRLSGFYFFFFASLGTLLPYWSLYLQSNAFTPVQIGWLMALLHGTKLIAPNVWGWLADRRGQRMPVIRFAALVATLCFSVILWRQTFAWMACVMVGFGFFWNAMLPQFEAVTFSYLDKRTSEYSRIRLWGSVGFVLTVVGLGWGLTWVSIEYLPWAMLLMLVAIWSISMTVPDAPSVEQAQTTGSLWMTLKQPVVLAFLLVCLLLQMSHGPYYVFFSIYLEAHGYSKPEIGLLWALGVVAEIVLFYWMHHLVRRLSLQRILMVSLVLTVLRWCLIGWFVDQVVILWLAQPLHAASFGAFHVVAIHLVHHYFRGNLQGRGQALYSSFSFGAGGMLGSLFSGYLWTQLGSTWVYGLAAGVAALAVWVSWRWSIAQACTLNVEEVALNPQER